MPSKKLASLIQSVPPATARSAAPLDPAGLPTPELVRRPPAGPSVRLLRDQPDVPLQVLIPAHIREELGIMGAKERASLRALILRAVRSLGIVVTDEEIKGKRGQRRS